MLELLISILLSFGMSGAVVDGKVTVNSHVISAAKTSYEFNAKGGDGALNSIVILDTVDPASASGN